MQQLELLIFDNDGVLVDSERLMNDVMSATTVERVWRDGRELIDAGAERVFHDMSELPALLGLSKP